jgi:prepilin-type N-terminal cleavage/methylation domain-containing protein
MKPNSASRAQRTDFGMTLLELMIAITVLALGLGGGMALLSTSIATNNRNKMDTTATTLSQMVLEQILAAGANATTTFTLTDCVGNVFTINPAGSSTGVGAAITSGGDIDYTGAVSPSTGYNMNYTVCKAAGQYNIYDIRWRITILNNTGTSIYRKQVVAAARPIGGASTSTYSQIYYAAPITLKSVAGD